jgi:hypothetical protein
MVTHLTKFVRLYCYNKINLKMAEILALTGWWVRIKYFMNIEVLFVGYLYILVLLLCSVCSILWTYQEILSISCTI